MARQQPEVRPEEQRGFAFHWVANVFFASVALLAGILFGERVPQDKFGAVFTGVVIIGLLMVPLTMSWERAGIERRRRASEKKSDPHTEPGDADSDDNPAPPEDESRKKSP